MKLSKKINHGGHGETRSIESFPFSSVKLRVLPLVLSRGFILPFFIALLLAGCSKAQREQAEAAEEQVTETGIEFILADFSPETTASTETTASEETVVSEEAVQEAIARQEPRFVLIPESARPGEPVTIAYSDAFDALGYRNLQAVLLDSRGRWLTRAVFFDLPGESGHLQEAGLKAAILAVPSTALIGDATIRIESGGGAIREIPFVIESREFRSETISLDQENSDLRTVPDPQKTAESEQLWAVISRTGREIYSGGPFTAPVESTRRTSPYGSRRVYNYADGESDTTIHAGVDIGVPTGTAVSACAAGRVVLARERIVTGNTVIVEHLPGVYSLYYHMDSIAVTESDSVEEGALLGESGSTGLATGPHLHWEIRVSTENADPDFFLSRPVLDKEAILNKLTN